MQEVLVDRRELLFEGLVELCNHLSVPAHIAASFASSCRFQFADIVRRTTAKDHSRPRAHKGGNTVLLYRSHHGVAAAVTLPD
jgi:hypothetical protein